MTCNETRHLGCDEQLFKRVVKTVFGQRRKMLRVSLRQLFDNLHQPTPQLLQHQFMTCRPEQLSIEEFVELTNLIAPSFT